VPTGRAAVAAVALVSIAASAVLLEALLRLIPQLAVDPSLARELGWRARHVTGVPAELLDAMRAAVGERDARLVLMTIPRRGSAVERLLVAWAERTGTPLLNLRTAYLAMPDDVRSRLYHGHWTAEGAAVTARLLAARLRSTMSELNSTHAGIDPLTSFAGG